MGKVKIAQTLARAGLHLGPTTVGRMLREPSSPTHQISSHVASTARMVTANRPNHVWHVDLTAVPTASGFWCSWSPAALPQYWPFCWWLALAVDHYSRLVIGFAVFHKPPDARTVTALLARAIDRSRATPSYIICDKGTQFWSGEFKAWCRRRRIRPRFGAVGQHGSISLIERAVLTMKQLILGLTLVPLRPHAFRQELATITTWYNEHRPHMALAGRTPTEVYFGRRPANTLPRWEPR